MELTLRTMATILIFIATNESVDEWNAITQAKNLFTLFS